MTATGCNKWKSLFSVGEEFDDEDLLDADWTTAAKSTSDRPASTSATVSLESSQAEHSTNVLASVRSLLIPKCSTTCHLSTLRTPTGSARDTSDVSITEKPSEVTFPPPEASRGLSSNQILTPSSEPLRVPQTPQPQDEFDDWDVDLEELDKSVSQVTSHISPAKRLRLSEFSGADPGVSQNRFSMPQAQHSSTIQTPVCPSTPIHHLNPVRGTITPVSRFPSPVTPRPPFASPQCQLRTPSSLRPRGSLFHAVSSAPTPSPTPRALNAPVLTNHLVQLVSAATKTPQRSGSAMTRSKTRRFPGPAGALPDQVTGQNLDDIVVTVPSTPAHGALARLRSEVSSSQGSEEEEFSRGPWAIMKTEMGLDEKNPSCFLHSFSVLMVLRKAALKQLVKNKVPNMAVVLKNITHTHADAKAFFRDPTGEMQGTVHRRLVEDRQAELKAGAVLLLKQVGVFSPSHRNHYLNVTPNNLLRIYPADGVLQDSQLFRSPLDLPAPCEPTKPPGGPVSQMVLRFEEEDEVENEVGESRAAVGCNESCEEPSGSRAADDAAWDADDLDELLGELPL